MKKALMGTTAMVAAAFTAGATGVASADEMAEDGMMAEPISLSIGGRSMWGVAIVDSDAKANNDDLAISNDVRITFSGSTVVDSGLEVGMRIDADGGEDKDSVIGEYAYVSGSFGELRVGNQDTASYKMSTAAPYATYFYGINTPFWSGHLSGEWHSTFAGEGAGGASLLYFSPVINGFQFGASYTPEAGDKANSNTVYSQEGHDSWSIGTRYDGAFGDTGITFAAGMTSKDVPMMAAVDPARETRDFTVMTFNEGGMWYLGVGTGGTSAARQVTDDDDEDTTNTDTANVFVNPNWDPDDAHEDEDEENIEAGRYRVPAADETLPGDFTNAVYKYIEVGTAADADIHNVHYMTKGKAAVPGRTVMDWNAGLVVSMSGVSVGGSYRVTDHDNAKDDTTQYDVGIMYGEGPWAVSANYGNKSQDSEDVDTDFSRLMATYNLGPGISMAGVLGSDAPANNQDTTFAAMALLINF